MSLLALDFHTSVVRDTLSGLQLESSCQQRNLELMHVVYAQVSTRTELTAYLAKIMLALAHKLSPSFVSALIQLFQRYIDVMQLTVKHVLGVLSVR